MARYRKRQLQAGDLFTRFEKDPSSAHVRNALGAIERLRDEGRCCWKEGSAELRRWLGGCNYLWNFVNRLGERRYVNKQDLPTAFREFIQEFEHHTERTHQMLGSVGDAVGMKSKVERLRHWCDLVYRYSTYALVSFWIDDKTEETTVSFAIRINRTTGEATVEGNHQVKKMMQVPRRYRASIKSI